jgi:N-formylglutamate amidohydrolase
MSPDDALNLNHANMLAPETPRAQAAQGDETSAPFEISLPAVLSTPLVFASPHSGRLYPKAMMQAAVLDADAIRRSEDAFVDTLVTGAAAFGIPVIAAGYARAYIDVNREPYELDQAMFEDKLPAYANAKSARVLAGLGSIARVVAEGQEIYRGKLTFADARQRIDGVHRPYHQAVQGLIDAARKKFGLAVLIDWHSMPSAAAGGDPRNGSPDMVLGDRFGAACASAVTGGVERELEKIGYRVARNAPYAGGFTTEFYGRPASGVHALQIELNRALYLNEASLEPSAGFGVLTENLQTLFARLSGWNWAAFF